jgi:3-oxoacyl-(acyl-carrier-protein) synthase
MIGPLRPRVVVTGMGIVSAAGCSIEGAWRELVAGRSAVDRIRRFDVSAYPSRIAAEIRDADLDALPMSTAWAGDGRGARRFAAPERRRP